MEAGATVRLSAGASPFVLPVRHRLRRYRRARIPRADAKPSEPEKSGAAPAKAEPQAPAPGAKASQPPEPMGPPPPPATWSAAEIEAARIDCDRRLSSLHAIYERAGPIREGACGSPFPIRLQGFDSERAPQLSFAPAPTISCQMAEALRRWLDDVVQRNAKAELHAAIVRIGVLSSYDCRTRYDDPAQRISQHAFANAIDIAEFVTAKGESITVADAWDAGDERAAFLRGIHDGACEIFGTALGPEANAAHKNHFHLDMIARRRPLCDFTAAQLRARKEADRKAAVPASAVKVPVAGGGEPAVSKRDAPVPAASEPEPGGTASKRRRRHRRSRYR